MKAPIEAWGFLNAFSFKVCATVLEGVLLGCSASFFDSVFWGVGGKYSILKAWTPATAGPKPIHLPAQSFCIPRVRKPGTSCTYSRPKPKNPKSLNPNIEPR